MPEDAEDPPEEPKKQYSPRLIRAALIFERTLWVVSLLAPFVAMHYGGVLWGPLASFGIMFVWWRFGFYISVIQPEEKRFFYLVEYGTVHLMCMIAIGVSVYYGFKYLWTH